MENLILKNINLSKLAEYINIKTAKRYYVSYKRLEKDMKIEIEDIETGEKKIISNKKLNKNYIYIQSFSSMNEPFRNPEYGVIILHRLKSAIITIVILVLIITILLYHILPK